MTITIKTNRGEILTLTKLRRDQIRFAGGRYETRIIYRANDGTYWTWYCGEFTELTVRAGVGGRPRFKADFLRFAN